MPHAGHLMRCCATPALALLLGCGSRTSLPGTDSFVAQNVGGNPTPTADAATAAGADGSTVGAADASSPDACAARLLSVLRAPIRLPYDAATLNLAGASGQGITLAEAEALLCVGANVATSGFYGAGTADMAWGPTFAVQLVYEPATQIANELGLWPGYHGTLDFHSADQAHTYSIGIDAVIQRDGQDYALDPHWSGGMFEAQLTELYNAMAATYRPEAADSESCVRAHHCVVNTADAAGYVDMPPLGVQLWSNDIVNKPSTIAIVNLVLSGQ